MSDKILLYAKYQQGMRRKPGGRGCIVRKNCLYRVDCRYRAWKSLKSSEETRYRYIEAI